MEEQKTKEAPKAFLDRNASWPLTIVYLGYLVGIYFAQQYTFNKNFLTNNVNGYQYYLLAILLGIVGTFLIYNLGKILFAAICGYQMVSMKILGLNVTKVNGKRKFSYNIMDFFTLSLNFAPKDDDVNKKPTLLFFGGIIFEAILMVLALIFFFTTPLDTKSSMSDFRWTFLFAVLYGFLTPLYEMMPLRQDYPTDMFNFIMTRNVEDLKAYNIYQINKKREITGEDFIVPEFESYDSFYKLHTLYYVYLKDLYESKLEKAFSVLEDMKYYSKYYLEDERYLPIAETIYLKFLIDDENGANKAYLSIKKDERKNVTSPSALTGYRIAFLVLASIHSDREALNTLKKQRETKISTLTITDSNRVKKEQEFYNSAIEKAKKLKPDLNIEA